LDFGNSSTNLAGPDTMNGNGGNDHMYGQGEADIMHGNDGDDLMEGNGSDDTMHGDAQQDDLVGGTSQEMGGTPDGSDTIYGDDDYDVILGDNAAITRPIVNDQWVINSFNDAVSRDITLYDVATIWSSPPAVSSGGDLLFGGAEDDLLYGQGNTDDVDDDNDGLINEDPLDGLDNDNDGSTDEDAGGDYIHGDAGEDYLEGNAGSDWLFGDAGNDDMVGGTGRINDDPATGTDGRLDKGDTLYGGTGFDVMAGDNALLVRTLVNGQWQSNTFNDGIQHEPRILLDVDSPDTAVVSGDDTMFGNEDDDLMYGQGGNDAMFGNEGDDFMEGNANVDTMHGNEDQDDMIGGTVEAGLTDEGDFMYGDAQSDVMLGDNGTIARPLDGSGLWQVDLNTGDIIRDVVLLDVSEINSPAPAANLSGDDEMYGDGDNDEMFGQGGDDDMHGGDDFDYMEGNHGQDDMYGDGGEDDMTGGGSANDGVIDADRIGDGLRDSADTMYGGEESDVMAGDNARLTRPVNGSGLWQIDPNTDDVVRDMQLFDVEHVGSPVDGATSGSDLMWGENGRDFMFGQGNDAIDDDGDGRFNEDPADGVDNDRNGRESAASVGFDCLDGSDNDEDGLTDTDDPDCIADIDEDGGGDEMHGGNDHDYMEGNHGSDWMFGDDGEDDMIGGNSAGDGHIFGGVVPTNLTDAHDTMRGGSEDDQMVGDNASIVRPTDANGFWQYLDGYGFNIVIRVVTMAQFPESSLAFGHDHMLGDDGHDEMYGQLGADYMEGNAGEDAIVGDLGLITSSLEDGSREEVIATNAPFLEDVIYAEGTLTRLVTLYSQQTGDGAEWDDTMLGGDDNDSIHGGAGDDLANGNNHEDHLFGGDGNDAFWGGPGHDHLWGGHHEDYLDVKPRPYYPGNTPPPGPPVPPQPADPPEWFTYAGTDNYQGLDIIYGGWDQDAMQADVGGPGPVPGDRLLDWVGAYNVYYTCPAAYGEGVMTRGHSPQVINFLETLSEADGAILSDTNGSSGFRELGMVFPNQGGQNSHPPHPDNPGHFTCN
jgi:Ca2+-binding RTX toxin-like protein